MEIAGPRSGFFHDDRAQTTFLSRVTSKIWTVPAHSSVLLFPAHQLETTVLPFASRIAFCVLKSLILGTSAWVSSQTASPFGLTSRTQRCASPEMSVLPFFKRI